MLQYQILFIEAYNKVSYSWKIDYKKNIVDFIDPGIRMNVSIKQIFKRLAFFNRKLSIGAKKSIKWQPDNVSVIENDVIASKLDAKIVIDLI